LGQYVDPKSSDVILDIGGYTGKISAAAYLRDNCKDVFVLEPKNKNVEYGRLRRPHIRFIEGGVESIPLPDEYFDKVVASFSFHHLSDQNKGLEEMKKVLKPDRRLIIFEKQSNYRKRENVEAHRKPIAYRCQVL
jgi:ubiquinone/menaquinone biosynthesis C-methylase UbiE